MNKIKGRINLLRALMRLIPWGVPKALCMLVAHSLGYDRPFSLRIHGRTIYFPSTSELYTAKQILLDHIYDTQLKDPKRIADLGANIGLASIFFAEKFPNARIDAYEPDPETFKYLQRNTIGLNVICHKQAIAAEHGEALFYRSPNSVASSLTPSTEAIEKVRVATITPEEVGAVDLLKIDIEGAESRLIGHAFSSRAVVGESTEPEAIRVLFGERSVEWKSSNGVFSVTRT